MRASGVKRSQTTLSAMHPLIDNVGRTTEGKQTLLDFQDGLARSVEERICLGVIPRALPVINGVPYRVFASLAQYRHWAARALPLYLGYAWQ